MTIHILNIIKNNKINIKNCVMIKKIKKNNKIRSYLEKIKRKFNKYFKNKNIINIKS